MNKINRFVIRACWATCGLLLVAWGASTFGSIQYGQQKRAFGLRDGAIKLTRINSRIATTPMETALIDSIGSALCPPGFTLLQTSSAPGTSISQSVYGRLGLVLPSCLEPVLETSHVCGSWNSWERPKPPFGGKFKPATTWVIPIWIPISAIAMIAMVAGAFGRRHFESEQFDPQSTGILESPNPLTIRSV